MRESLGCWAGAASALRLRVREPPQAPGVRVPGSVCVMGGRAGGWVVLCLCL